MNSDVTATELDAFAARILGSGRVRVPLDDLLVLWAAAVPRLVSAPGSRAGLRAALDELAEGGVVALPSRSWDRSSTPELPRFVDVPDARRAGRGAAHRSYPWRPELGWVASLRTVGVDQLDALQRINAWLADAEHRPVVPHRVRSAELFGDEKALDQLARSVLFGNGRLSFELLRCVRRPSPLPAAVVGDGPDVLVVENSDPYWMAIDALNSTGGHLIGAVVWGSGRTFPSQVPTLGVDVAGRGPVTGTVWYWGDLDPVGVAIAVDAAHQARRLGVAEIRVPVELWAAHLSCTVTGVGSCRWDDTGAAWFAPDQWEAFAAVREAQGRVSQEACAPDAIASWLDTLARSR